MDGAAVSDEKREISPEVIEALKAFAEGFDAGYDAGYREAMRDADRLDRGGW